MVNKEVNRRFRLAPAKVVWSGTKNAAAIVVTTEGMAAMPTIPEIEGIEHIFWALHRVGGCTGSCISEEACRMERRASGVRHVNRECLYI